MTPLPLPPLAYTLKLVGQNWAKNHRHHGGVSAVAGCCLGTARIRGMAGPPETVPAAGAVDCVTFSVVPNLTRLWAQAIAHAIPGHPRIWIGDCSGGLQPEMVAHLPVRVYKLINYLHGWKLDLFFEKFVRSELFVVSDDDIFWLDQAPWQWAVNQFSDDPRLAVVSLEPRQRFRWQIGGAEYQPMGSYCLIIRRDIWLKEALSFQAVPKPSPCEGSYAGLYDTCDFANCELIRRGYRIATAPAALSSSFAAFKGVSMAALRIQKQPHEGYARAYGDGPAPIVQACLINRELSRVLRQANTGSSRCDLIDPVLAERAEREMIPLLEPGKHEEMRAHVAELSRKLSAALGLNVPAAATAG